jgi:hypothetical protein
MFYLLEETYAHLTRIEYENYVYSKSFRLGTMSTADSRESCRRSSDTAVSSHGFVSLGLAAWQVVCLKPWCITSFQHVPFVYVNLYRYIMIIHDL